MSSGGATDHHEWVSFELEGETYLFDVTFLAGNWECIFGRGCPGVLAEEAEELEQGCCSHGAHFADAEDHRRVVAAAQRLSPELWQHFTADDPTETVDGETSSRLVDGACIFLNRPGFAGGIGCALHLAAAERGERPMDTKPEVCWQLPVRLEHSEDDNGHITNVLREWKRRDWGEGGAEFHWWCTEDDRAFVGHEPVYITLRDEIIGLIGEAVYSELEDRLAGWRAPVGGPGTAVSMPARTS